MQPTLWQQIYDPFGNMIISTLLGAIPVVVMLVGLGFLHLKAHIAAGAGLLAALAIAIFVYGMPASMAGNAALFGGLTGLLPIGWIVLNIIFLHQLTEQNGSFKVLQDSIAGITEDRRLQLLLIAFAFGAFFEGAAGFGTPVAVTAAILIELGRRDGQDDRRAVHRGRLDRHALVQPRRRHFAIRFLAFDCAGLSDRRPGDAAGVCVAIHLDGGEVTAGRAPGTSMKAKSPD